MGKPVKKCIPLQIVQTNDSLIGQIEQWSAANPLQEVSSVLNKASEFASDFVLNKRRSKAVPSLVPLEYEIYDCTVAALISAVWKYNKQVYHFSREFYDMLQEVDDFKIGWSLFGQLPYQAFYLEVEAHEKIDGVMVRYMQGKRNESPALLFTICLREGLSPRFFSAIASPEKYDDFKRYFKREVIRNKADFASPHITLMREVFAFVFQACMYLCAKNAQIEEDVEQKKIYKPSKTPHNKMSEVRKWDVGMRITRDLRAAKSAGAEKIPKVAGSITGRKRPRQHWRKAHWHSFWAGPRSNRRKVVHFIAPILVNDIGDDTPVVVHQ